LESSTYRADKLLRIARVGKYITFAVTGSTGAGLTELFTFNMHKVEARMFADRLLALVEAEEDVNDGINGVALGPAPSVSDQLPRK
jgi:hypothetical protein